jgi:mRNA interferase RelE/StbE
LAYNIAYKKSVQRDLKKLSRAESNRILNQVEEELSKNAETYPILKGRFAGLRKYRVGDFRVIFAVLGDDVLVLRIGHRKDVYKK